jgi:hypothetical protein
VPALALDVWLSYELRRAGFGSDQTWPRPKHPRILPASVARLLEELKDKAGPIRDFIEQEGAVKGVTKSSATILGKNYWKQVDVIVTDYDSGPELLISTKRMDSSYGKNAPNRVEESYGDAKNLRLRHPLAAMGFVFGLRSDILQKEPATAEWLFDLLVKLGREDDAYHSTALILMEYAGGGVVDDGDRPDRAVVEGPDGDSDAGDDEVPAVLDEADQAISELPEVKILLSETPALLDPRRFLASMVERVLNTTPVTMHKEARKRRIFRVEDKTPQKSSDAEINAFCELVASGGEVALAGLADRVRGAKRLSFMWDAGHMIGVAGLKRPSKQHRAEVEAGAGETLDLKDIPFELGWVYVHPDHRGGKSAKLCDPLIQVEPTKGIFATSRADNLKMHRALERLGFERVGGEWSSMLNPGMLWLFVRKPRESK